MRILDDAVSRPSFHVQVVRLRGCKMHYVVLAKAAMLSRLVFPIAHLDVRQSNVLLLELVDDEKLQLIEL